jgi:hypothetical protein
MVLVDHGVDDQCAAAAVGDRPLVGRLVVGRTGLLARVFQQLLDPGVNLLARGGREAGAVLARDL